MFQEKFVNWERASRDTIDVKRIYIDMAQDVISGLLLSQLVYWHLPNNHGESKLRVQQEGHFWVARTYQEWFYDCRLTKKQVTRAFEHLAKLGLVITKTFHFKRKPCLHVRIDWTEFSSTFVHLLNNVNTNESVWEYWAEVRAKDGRSIATKKPLVEEEILENDVKDLKGTLEGKVPLSNFTGDVKYHKGTLQSTEKVLCISTENTTQTTSSETNTFVPPSAEQLAATEPVINPFEEYTFEQRLAELYRLSVADSTIRDVPQFFRLCFGKLPILKAMPNSFRQRMWLLSTYLSNREIDETSGGMEAKAVNSLKKWLDGGSYTETEIYACAAWAMHHKMFESDSSRKGYSSNLTGLIKILPTFKRQANSGTLSLEAKKQFETTAERNERLRAEKEQNDEQISNNIAKLAEERIKRFGKNIKFK